MDYKLLLDTAVFAGEILTGITVEQLIPILSFFQRLI